MQTSNNIYHLL